MRSDKNEETRVDKELSTGFSGAEIESVVNQVMENAYVRYREAIEAKRPVQTPLKVSKEDFIGVIDQMRPSIMANQTAKGMERPNGSGKTTNIDRIREMQKIYKFARATK